MAPNDLNKRQHPYLHAIGTVALEWNRLDHHIDMLLWEFITQTGDYEVGRIITAPLGSQTKTDILINLVRLRKPEPKLAALIEAAIKAFHICRENRNTIAHAIGLEFHGRAGWTLGKRSKGNPAVWLGYKLKRADIVRVARDTWRTAKLVNVLRIIVEQRTMTHLPGREKRLPLPKKPALPRKLSPLPPEALTADRRPP
jgi:hypothetical protein